MSDGERHLALIIGSGAADRPRPEARIWHPAQGGRPSPVPDGRVRPGDRARVRWSGRPATAEACDTDSHQTGDPVTGATFDRVVGTLMEIVGLR